MSVKLSSTKSWVFIGIMATLGNVLSGLSILSAPILPAVSLGPYSISLALDLSHLTTFIGSLYGGSSIGGLTGLIGGLVAANEFGFSQGNIVTGFTLPLGKALTGIAAGFLMRALGLQERSRRRVPFIASTLISYIPEAIFTVFIFLSIFPLVFGTLASALYPIVASILIKASIEMVAEGTVLLALSSNQGFVWMMKNFFSKKMTTETLRPEPEKEQKVF
jgi:branched-subunit amino acid transport protein